MLHKYTTNFDEDRKIASQSGPIHHMKHKHETLIRPFDEESSYGNPDIQNWQSSSVDKVCLARCDSELRREWLLLSSCGYLREREGLKCFEV